MKKSNLLIEVKHQRDKSPIVKRVMAGAPKRRPKKAETSRIQKA
jgi:hypothetical protein